MKESPLKIRIIPSLLLKGGRCVKGVNFTNFRDTGNPVMAARVYDSQKADELVFLDITATNEGKEPLYELAAKVADECFMPFTIGGGIKTIGQIEKLLKCGADKVSINTAAVENPKFITEAAYEFGAQCVVVSVDVKKTQKGYEVYTHSGTKATGNEPVSFTKKMESLGAGEILLTSIDHEGTNKGYDLELTRSVADALTIPVIAHGGVGNLQHLVDGVRLGHASAVSCASMFHFTDQSTLMARTYMKTAGLNVRPQW